jgi:hypothetical protein
LLTAISDGAIDVWYSSEPRPIGITDAARQRDDAVMGEHVAF